MERWESKGLAPGAPEGARSATGGAPGGAAVVEVVAKARRRRFSAGYKTRILREAEACAGTGQIGALLRREGLYSSHLTEWRKLQAQGALRALAAKKRGRKPVRDAREREIAKLSRENARLRRKLAQAEAVIEVQKNDPRAGLPPVGRETRAEVGSGGPAGEAVCFLETTIP